MTSERIDHWTKMRRSLAKFSESEASNHTPSSADFTTTTPELKFSVHTGLRVQAAGGTDKSLEFYSSDSSKFNFLIGANILNTDTFQIIPSSASGGTGYATAAMTITATGNVGINKASPNTNLDVNGYIEWNGESRTTSDFTKASDTTLAAITGLSATLTAGKTYAFDVSLYVTSSGGGVAADLGGGTATATAAVANMTCFSTNGLLSTTATSLTYSTPPGLSAVFCEIKGTITVNSGGTLIPRAAQISSNATAMTVKTGSTMFVHQIN
jgi:hypothetical protein